MSNKRLHRLLGRPGLKYLLLRLDTGSSGKQQPGNSLCRCLSVSLIAESGQDVQCQRNESCCCSAVLWYLAVVWEKCWWREVFCFYFCFYQDKHHSNAPVLIPKKRKKVLLSWASRDSLSHDTVKMKEFLFLVGFLGSYGFTILLLSPVWIMYVWLS